MARPAKRIQHEVTEDNLTRYNLVIPKALYNEVQTMAKEQRTSALDLFRRFIKIGLIVAKASEDPDTSFIIRRNGTEREILFT